MNILMIAKSEYPTDVRVRREAEALANDGHMVQVLSTDSAEFDSRGVRVLGLGDVPGLTSARPPSSAAFRAARWVLLPEHRQRANDQFQERVLDRSSRIPIVPDVIHAHDFPALVPGSKLAAINSASLIYDSHEYWAGLARYGRPDPIRRQRNIAMESKFARRADRVISVSEGAAALIAENLGVDHVTVVRNTFPARSDLSVVDKPNGAVYAGRIGSGRDLETVFAAPIWDKNQQLHLMGKIQQNFAVPAFSVRHKVGSMDQVDRLLASVGIALVTLAKGPPNHDVALPNKLFQAIAAGIPVLASDLPEIRKLVSQGGLGALYTPGDASSFATAYRSLFDRYDDARAATTAAQAIYDWSIDSSRLVALYRELGSSRSRRQELGPA